MAKHQDVLFSDLLQEVRACQLCADTLPFAPRPVVRGETSARILVIGQAPGTKVHNTGIPWNDPSGDKLREWLAIDRETFYDESRIAIIPMGFCYPGKGPSGDLPPKPECADTWHKKLISQLPNLQLTLLIGQYSQRYYLGKPYPTLTETVRNWQNFLPAYFALPHPSPRNRLWLKKNPWFERDVIPELKNRVQDILAQ